MTTGLSLVTKGLASGSGLALDSKGLLSTTLLGVGDGIIVSVSGINPIVVVFELRPGDDLFVFWQADRGATWYTVYDSSRGFQAPYTGFIQPTTASPLTGAPRFVLTINKIGGWSIERFSMRFLSASQTPLTISSLVDRFSDLELSFDASDGNDGFLLYETDLISMLAWDSLTGINPLFRDLLAHDPGNPAPPLPSTVGDHTYELELVPNGGWQRRFTLTALTGIEMAFAS